MQPSRRRTSYSHRHNSQGDDGSYETQKSEDTQASINPIKLHWSLGFDTVYPEQVDGNSRDFSSLPFRWSEFHSDRPPDEPIFNLGHSLLTSPTEIYPLEKSSELSNNPYGGWLHNNKGDETTLVHYDEKPYFPSHEVASCILQPDLPELTGEYSTFSFNNYRLDNKLSNSDILVDGDGSRIGCWDESLGDLSMLQQPFSHKSSYLIPTDPSIQSHCTSSEFGSAECDSNDNSNFCYEQTNYSLFKESPDLHRSSAVPRISASKRSLGPDLVFDSWESSGHLTTNGKSCKQAYRDLSPITASSQHQEPMWSSVTAALEDDLAFLDSKPLPDSYDSAGNKYADQYHFPPELVSPRMRMVSSTTTSDKKTKTLLWDHTEASQFQRNKIAKNVKKCFPVGRRKGPLSLEQAKKAKNVRNAGACLRCWLSKVPCSSGEICDRCIIGSPSDRRLCTRLHLEDYFQLFFPEFLVSHLDESNVRKLEFETCSSFVDKDVEVDIQCAEGHPPMSLRVTEFTPTSDDICCKPIVSSRNPESTPMFKNVTLLPVALRGVDMDDLVETCRKYITATVQHQGLLLSSLPGRTNKVSKQVLDATCRYYKSISPSSNATLLEKALMLPTMHHFMGWTISISEQSLPQVLNHLRKPTVQLYETNIISRLLNSQLKSAMQRLLREVTREVLVELEQELRTRKKSVWATCFCVISILCICMEDVQIAVDGFVVHSKFHESGDLFPTLENCMEECRKLDDLLYTHVTELFHGVYRTTKSPSARKNARVYNPILDVTANGNTLDKQSLDLVNDIRHIVFKNGKSTTTIPTSPNSLQGLTWQNWGGPRRSVVATTQ